MKKLNSAEKRALKERLIERWCKLIREDQHADEVYELLAEVLGTSPNNVPEAASAVLADAVLSAISWLRRLP